MAGQASQEFLPFEAIRGRKLGVDVLLPRQVAEECRERGWPVSERTVERWITKDQNRLPAVKATIEQARNLGYSGNISGNGIFFVRLEDVALVPKVRRYPAGTKRERRKQYVTPGTQPGASGVSKEEWRGHGLEALCDEWG